MTPFINLLSIEKHPNTKNIKIFMPFGVYICCTPLEPREAEGNLPKNVFFPFRVTFACQEWAQML